MIAEYRVDESKIILFPISFKRVIVHDRSFSVIEMLILGYARHLLHSEARAATVHSGAMLTILLTIGFISMVVYGPHLYTTGLDMDVKYYFSFATFLIAIPIGVKYFT